MKTFAELMQEAETLGLLHKRKLELLKKSEQLKKQSENLKEVDQEHEKTGQELGKAGVKVGRLAVEDIEFAPEIFKARAFEDSASGTNWFGRLNDGFGFNPNLAGTISVWVDKDNEVGQGAGKVYVVDGHYRMEFAKREGVKSLNVFYLDAANVHEARKMGAEINVHQENGTVFDIAKVLREYEDLQAYFKPRSEIAQNAAMLAKLSDCLFDLVLQGEISVKIGVLIAEHLEEEEF